MINKKTPDNALSLLKQVIAIPSFVDDGQNEKALINFVYGLISSKTDLKITKQFVEKDRFNLIVRDAHPVKVVLFGHLDTVLPNQQTQEAFTPQIKNGKIFGLGSVDMKAGVAIMLDIAINHHRPGLAYVFTVDEEYQFKGAQKLKKIKNIHPDWIINVEPTNNKILNGCRGITEFSFDIYGKSVHASRKDRGVNAIEKSIKLVSLFQKQISLLDNKKSGKNTINLAYIHGGVLKSFDSKSQPNISGLGMVVPNFARLNCEIRLASPKIDKKYILVTFKKIAKQEKIKLDNFYFKFHLANLFTPTSKLKPFEQSILSSGLKKQYLDLSSAGFYEVQLLQQAWGGRTVIFGPGPMEMAHMADEYADLDTITKTKETIEFFLKRNL